MATATSSLPASMQNFIGSCSAAQIAQLIQALQDTQSSNAAGTASNAASTMTVKAGVAAAKTGKKQRDKKAKSESVTGGPKRPLNSWMAFRKYYNASLAPNTQKSISKILTTWWHDDPFEAKWAILAKAYSIVRGSREKAEVPLDGFFAICAPLIGVIPPDRYMAWMGWQLTQPDANGEDKTPKLTRTARPSLAQFPDEYTSTSLGVDDLVWHCYNRGYAVTTGDVAPEVTNTSESLTMAVQPIVTDGVDNSVMLAGQDFIISPSDANLQRALLEALASTTAAENTPSENTFSNAATVIEDAGGSYPYNATFDPTNHFQINFNPNEVEEGGAWDAFDTTVLGNSSDEAIDWTEFLNQDAV